MADYWGPGSSQARGAEIGALTGSMTVAGATKSGRDARGRFTSYQTQAKDQNRRDARTLQDLVVAMQNSRLKRPGVSTGRLSRVTAAEGNRVASLDGFYVGIQEFLSKSEAKYWRTIEFGSKEVWKRPFIGTILTGWFGGSIEGMYENSWGTVARGGEPFTRPGEGTGGKFRPYNRATAAALKGSGVRSGRAVVKKEIAPQHAYRDAWRAFGGTGALRRRHAQILRRALET